MASPLQSPPAPFDVAGQIPNSSLTPPYTVTFWEDDPESWDRFIVEDKIGVTDLGLATVTVRKASQQDAHKNPGSTGTDLTHTGYELAQVQIDLRLWTQEHLNSYQRLLQHLKPIPGVAPSALRCYHPALAILGIAELYFALWTPPKPGAVRGVFEVTMTAEEFDPTKKGLVAVIKASTDWATDGAQVNTPGYGKTKQKDPPSVAPDPG